MFDKAFIPAREGGRVHESPLMGEDSCFIAYRAMSVGRYSRLASLQQRYVRRAFRCWHLLLASRLKSCNCPVRPSWALVCGRCGLSSYLSANKNRSPRAAGESRCGDMWWTARGTSVVSINNVRCQRLSVCKDTKNHPLKNFPLSLIKPHHLKQTTTM